MGAESNDVFRNVELKYSLTTVSSFAYFYKMVMKMLPLDESSVLPRSKATMCETNSLGIVR